MQLHFKYVIVSVVLAVVLVVVVLAVAVCVLLLVLVVAIGLSARALGIASDSPSSPGRKPRDISFPRPIRKSWDCERIGPCAAASGTK